MNMSLEELEEKLSAAKERLSEAQSEVEELQIQMKIVDTATLRAVRERYNGKYFKENALLYNAFLHIHDVIECDTHSNGMTYCKAKGYYVLIDTQNTIKIYSDIEFSLVNGEYRGVTEITRGAFIHGIEPIRRMLETENTFQS